MHLLLTLSTGLTEAVSGTAGAAVVNALYDLALNGLDNSSTVSGRISIYAASREKVEYLAGTNGIGGNGLFPNLYITCSTYYVDFMDNAFGQVCANLYGDGAGVTEALLLIVTDVTALRSTNNTSVLKLDFRRFPAISYQGNKNWSFPNATEIYINKAGSSTSLGQAIQADSFLGIGTQNGSRRYIDKLIINTIQTRVSSGSTLYFLASGTNSNQTSTDYGTIAIRNFYAPNGGNFAIGDYTTRGGRTITNLYLGSNTVVPFKSGYGDNIFNILNIYVPTGMVSAYEAESSWSKDGTVHTFYEYDFATDPDGIFSAFN